MKPLNPDSENPFFNKALKSIILKQIERRKLDFNYIARKTGLSEEFLHNLLEVDGEIHHDYIILIASSLLVTPESLIRKAKISAAHKKKKILSKKPAQDGIKIATAVAELSGRDLGVKFILKDDPVVDRNDLELMKRVKAERKARAGKRIL